MTHAHVVDMNPLVHVFHRQCHRHGYFLALPAFSHPLKPETNTKNRARGMASRLFFFLAAALVFCGVNAFMLPSPLPLRAGASSRVLSVEEVSDFGGRSKGSMDMMRHGKRFKKLGKAADQRKALLRALTTEGEEETRTSRGREG